MEQLRPVELKLIDELFGMSSGYSTFQSQIFRVCRFCFFYCFGASNSTTADIESFPGAVKLMTFKQSRPNCAPLPPILLLQFPGTFSNGGSLRWSFRYVANESPHRRFECSAALQTNSWKRRKRLGY